MASGNSVHDSVEIQDQCKELVPDWWQAIVCLMQQLNLPVSMAGYYLFLLCGVPVLVGNNAVTDPCW